MKEIVKEKIASLKVVNSNRFIEIDGSKYYVVLKYDAQFGIVSKEYITHPATGEKLLAYNKLAVIHEHAVTLYFDKQWNFVKKKSYRLERSTIRIRQKKFGVQQKSGKRKY